MDSVLKSSCHSLIASPQQSSMKTTCQHKKGRCSSCLCRAHHIANKLVPVMDLQCLPTLYMVKFQPPVLQNVTVVGGRIFKKLITLKRCHQSEPQSNLTGVLKGRGNLNTQEQQDVDAKKNDPIKSKQEGHHLQAKERLQKNKQTNKQTNFLTP